MVKVYGAAGLLTDRDRERKLCAHLRDVAPQGMCKAVLLEFLGGHVEEFIQGQTLSFAEMREPERNASPSTQLS